MNKKSLLVYSLISTALIFSVLIAGCGRELSDRNAPTEVGTAPPTPDNLDISVDDQGLTLTWTISDSTNIARYRIYRSDSTDSDFEVADSTNTRTYTDTGLANGITYFYQISSVDSSGFEGYLSETVSAMPEIYAIIINDNLNTTSQLDVELTLIAPEGTRYMRIANDSSFTNAVWEDFAPEKSWRLNPPDGEKMVYVGYRDANDNPLSRFKYDSIVLDRFAGIDSVLENTSGQTMTAGDVIRFTIYTTDSETNGEAFVQMESLQRNIYLYDEGTGADATANDGIYTADFTIPPGVEVTNASITGHFTDEAGNAAEPREATSTVDIQNPPEAVRLLPPLASPENPTSIDLNWSPTEESDFAFYRIFRKTTPGVDTSSTLVTTVSTPSQTSYTDEDLAENTVYYYRVYIYDQSNLFAGSNEDSALAGVDEPPDTVTLFQPYNVAEDSLSLSWTQTSSNDFSAYYVFRAESADFSDSLIVTTISSVAGTNYNDGSLSQNTTYYYKIGVLDRGGNSSVSNMVNATTLTNTPPDTVTCNSPFNITDSSMTITWSACQAIDFSAYWLFRSEDDFATDSSLVTTVSSRLGLSYVDTGLEPATAYYYKVIVYDEGGLYSISNTVNATTATVPAPTAVTLLPISVADSSGVSLRLTWTMNEDEGFASYKIYMDTTSPVTPASNLMATITNQSTTTTVLNNFGYSQTYYFRVYVYNRADDYAESNEQSINVAPPF
ncbi:MAG: hypothetical protein GF307_08390 [candidate division Zixibacteria bacterium]|nr:hypothetical protein [candidate division Zixibacteria bacterium]